MVNKDKERTNETDLKGHIKTSLRHSNFTIRTRTITPFRQSERSDSYYNQHSKNNYR